MLLNEEFEVFGLNFIGFEDLWSNRFQPEKAMQYFSSEKANLVLCHNPDACDLDIWNGYQGWILSGILMVDNAEFLELLRHFFQ